MVPWSVRFAAFWIGVYYAVRVMLFVAVIGVGVYFGVTGHG